MIITPSHFIDTAIRDLIAGGSDMPVRRMIVWHFTAGATARSSINAMRERGVSAHLVIDRDGTIYQCRAFDRTAGHAGGPGMARWRDPSTGKLYNGVNGCGSIGLEISNAGDNPELARRMGGTVKLARHRQDSKAKEWEVYPPAQLDVVLAVSLLLKRRYNLDDATGHEQVAPERKNDPGPLFPMLQFREALGFKNPPPVFYK